MSKNDKYYLVMLGVLKNGWENLVISLVVAEGRHFANESAAIERCSDINDICIDDHGVTDMSNNKYYRFHKCNEITRSDFEVFKEEFKPIYQLR